MRGFAVLAQGFTMISRKYDKRVFIQMILSHILKKLPQFKINIGHFSVVRIILVFRLERFRRIIPLVRIKTMDPEKPGTIPAFKPVQGFLNDHFCLSFYVRKFLVIFAAVIVVIDIKPLR